MLRRLLLVLLPQGIVTSRLREFEEYPTTPMSLRGLTVVFFQSYYQQGSHALRAFGKWANPVMAKSKILDATSFVSRAPPRMGIRS